MKVAVIGAGYWGPNLIRNFASLDEVDGVIACDRDADRLAKMRKMFPGIETCSDENDAISNPEVAAVAIATPVSTHFEIARRAIEAGKHCIIEKPMTASVAEGEELIELAANKQVTLFVDHTFVYTGAVRKM